MSRIHPSSSSENKISNDPVKVSSSPKLTTLTVWKRSSMSFQGTDGFTVYDGHGRLAFRVDNYSRNNGWSCATNEAATALVLMDGSGRPLLTLKPQIFSFQSQWNGCAYREDHKGSSNKDRTIFLMRRPSSTFFGRTRNQESQCEAEVFFSHHTEPEYRIEGSFWNRNSRIRSIARGEVVAKIIRKRASGGSSSRTMVLSEEVFSLVVSPGFDPQLIMAFVVILDRICYKPSLFTPLMCS
uniref:Putative tubby C-terminal-like domain-containing protein n=2 Tax=Helianthus annuus TaxID=4232 RepID=A0A251SIR1_HELAN